MRPAVILISLAVAGTAHAQDAAAPATPREEPPLPEKILPPPSPESAPAVQIRTLDNGDTVEEYRQNGRLYEVRVRPRDGVPYTLLATNGDGRLDRRDGDGPVAPVYYTLYRWD